MNIVYAEAIIRTESNIKVEMMTKGKKNEIIFFIKVIKDKKNVIIYFGGNDTKNVKVSIYGDESRIHLTYPSEGFQFTNRSRRPSQRK